MGTSAGPSLQGIGRGGASDLVLEMDAHDAKSYPGEPTTNLIAYPHYTGATLDTGQTGTNGGWGATWGYEISEIPGPNGTTVRAFSIELTAVVSPFTYSASGTPYNVTGINSQYAAMTSGTTYTASCWAKVEKVSGGSHTDENLLYFTGASSIGAPSMTVGPEWTHISSTVTPGATGNYRLYHYFYSVAIGDKIWFTMPQIEQKGYATPFVRSQLLDFSQQGYSARPASVNLMIHGNVGTGQNFSDSSPSKDTITANGNTTHSDAQSKFSGGSFLFDGTGDYLEPQSTTLLDVTSNTQSFTVDMWVYPTSIATSGPAAYRFTSLFSKGTVYLSFGFESDGTIKFYTYDGTQNICETSTGIMQTDQWQHIAYVSNAGTLALYYNGVSKTLSSTTLVKPSQTGGQGVGVKPKIGHGDTGAAADGFIGYIDEYRITDGTALWRGGFTPPTRRNLSAPVVDRSGNDNGGNFATTDPTDVVTYRDGQVIETIANAYWNFDGTDDLTTIGYHSSLDTPNAATFSVWLYPEANGEFLNRGTSDSGASPDNPRFYVYWNLQKFYFDWSATGSDQYVTTAAGGFPANTWVNVVATVVAGGRMEVYINGGVASYETRNNADSMANPLPNTNDPIQLGAATWIPRYFTGKIASIGIYDVALTAQQIVENFNQQRSRFNI